MYDMMKGITGAARIGSASGFNMQRSVRGRGETFTVDSISLAAAARRNGARVAASARGCETRLSCARRAARTI